MSLFEIIILAIIEGLTEYLPVSSTGHIILGLNILGISSTDFTKVFTVAVQFGGILAVVVLYWKKFIQSSNFYITLFIAFIPSAIIGLIFESAIDQLLDSVVVVGCMLILGGVVLIFIDRWFIQNSDIEFPSKRKAFVIGCFQIVALLPGVSRSAATIIGGLSQKLTRQNAAEFSFFLAVPTLIAATGYKCLSFYSKGYTFSPNEIKALVVGNTVAFIVALIAIKSFIFFLTKHGFKWFGYYRIFIGVLFLFLHYYYHLNTF